MVAAAVAAQAQQLDPARALREQLDRIFTAHAYDPPGFGPLVWLPDSLRTVLEKSAETADASDRPL